MSETVIVRTPGGPLLLVRAAIQGGMRLPTGGTLLLLQGRQVRTQTPPEDIWPGVELPPVAAVPPGPRDAEADAALAAEVERRRAARDVAAELERAKLARQQLEADAAQSAARAAADEAAAAEASAAARAQLPEPPKPTPSSSGGSRPGAGRKPKATRSKR